MSFDTPQMYRWKDPSLPPQAPALQLYFLQDPQVNPAATAASGVQTYDNVLVAYIGPMGNSKSNVAHEIERTLPDGTVKVNQFYAMKYAEQVKHYKAGTGAESTGTPLRDLIGMTAATQMNLKARGIHTLEMLADMQDSAGGDMMGFWDLRDRARKHIEMREKNAPMLRIEAIEEAHRKEVDSLTRQLDELRALIGDRAPVAEPETPRRGGRRNAVAEAAQ